MYRLNVAKLRAVAAQHGDKTPYAIAKRTGVSISSVYRYVDGTAQPDLNSALRLSTAYDQDIRTLMDPVDDSENQPAGAAA
ncbi:MULTISPECIES: helix-turn-helix domain-containing protein [Streptomyces]|uniref:helix-turn-helix domain-containing protein n=1 Tax=Streptomyces TaxID=1883 RepID=UPI0016757638|nr:MULTISPECIES: helix-turn-helix transcriptional regulator [Streptomyces]MBK3524879.1 helix-turn-helix transcriptional regulator [Streptomyces sp. MBT70]